MKNIKQMNNNEERYPGNTIHPTAIIAYGVEMGEGNYIGPYCIIGESAEKVGHFNKRGRVIIGDNNTFTKQVTIDSGGESYTIIGSGCILLKNAHVGHDCVIYHNVVLSCNAMIGGHSTINERCNIGLGAAIHQRTELPEGCMVGMNSTITKKTPLQPFRKYAGTPARDIGPNTPNK
jgi:UDP-N-acetylglucosamine acyltransferase